MSTDVDGSPHAYSPYSIASKSVKIHGKQIQKQYAVPQPGFQPLDHEENAHAGAKLNKKIVGYVTARKATDGSVVPIPQGSSDPAPGYFISTTGYKDKSKSSADPNAYVNAETTNYIVQKNGVGKPGDTAVVHDLKNNTTANSIIGDTGHSDGSEGSQALLRNLGCKSASANTSPSEVKGGRYVVRVYPGSAPADGSFTGGSQQSVEQSARQTKVNTDFTAEQAAYNSSHKKK